MHATSRCLEYAGVNPEWEQREIRGLTEGGIRTATNITNYLLGRLIEEDLHISCHPMLPPNVDALNSSIIEGKCILQVVDIVNIGANMENRTKETFGASRTLKLCLTDGHQTVVGFEFQCVSQLSMATPRGSKVLVENVPVRHGMLLLTPDTCQLLGISDNKGLDLGRPVAEGRNNEKTRAPPPSGAYSSALVSSITVVENVAKQKTSLYSASDLQLELRPRSLAEQQALSAAIETRMIERPTEPKQVQSITGDASKPLATTASHPTAQPQSISPSVLVDISNDDERMEDENGDNCVSDGTDSSVEHLFYSPKTPRLVTQRCPSTTANAMPSRKRPHPSSYSDPPRVPPLAVTKLGISKPPIPETHFSTKEVVDVTSPDTNVLRESKDLLSGYQLIPEVSLRVTKAPLIDRSRPFQYLRVPRNIDHDFAVHLDLQHTVILVRGFVKSVVTFQFNAGAYQLKVLIEDGTATHEVDVDEGFVEQLMGVPCRRFMDAMKTAQTTAHAWAAKMQASLMTMQGIMRLHLSQQSNRLILMQCRPYTDDEGKWLLERLQQLL